MTEWKKARSSAQEKPKELDTTSSAFYVYERRNITQEEVIDQMTKSSILEWTFEERQYTKEEYYNLNSLTTQLLMQQITNLEVELLTLRSELQCQKN